MFAFLFTISAIVHIAIFFMSITCIPDEYYYGGTFGLIVLIVCFIVGVIGTIISVFAIFYCITNGWL